MNILKPNVYIFMNKNVCLRHAVFTCPLIIEGLDLNVSPSAIPGILGISRSLLNSEFHRVVQTG
jgi:hypothetical protein